MGKGRKRGIGVLRKQAYKSMGAIKKKQATAAYKLEELRLKVLAFDKVDDAEI